MGGNGVDTIPTDPGHGRGQIVRAELDDVPDPIGLSAQAYADCAEQIDQLVTPVVAALAKLA